VRYTKHRGFLGDAYGSKEKYKGFSVAYDSFDNDNSVSAMGVVFFIFIPCGCFLTFC
jgi:hypothetical protein